MLRFCSHFAYLSPWGVENISYIVFVTTPCRRIRHPPLSKRVSKVFSISLSRQLGRFRRGGAFGRQLGRFRRGGALGHQLGRFRRGGALGRQLGYCRRGGALGRQLGRFRRGGALGSQLGHHQGFNHSWTWRRVCLQIGTPITHERCS